MQPLCSSFCTESQNKVGYLDPISKLLAYWLGVVTISMNTALETLEKSNLLLKYERCGPDESTRNMRKKI